MLGTLERDVATAVAILDRLPAEERGEWVARLDRGTYRFVLGPGLAGRPVATGRGAEIGARMRDALAPRFPVTVEAVAAGDARLQAHLTLQDGQPLTIDVTPALIPLAAWLPGVLVAQLALLVLCSALAVRQAIRPLVELAAAADALDPAGTTPRLGETGPREVAHAARAFNAMRDRIAGHLDERVRILAAISHDLQTPITRMRLRAEISEDSPGKDKLIQDLAAIERLVQDGIAYARSAHGNGERAARIDIGAFVESLVYDYQDVGQAVAVRGAGSGTMGGQSIAGGTILTRPHALRRILTNLIDNGLKFGGSAELSLERESGERAKGDALLIRVLDSGPGIPGNQLDAVLQPFVRLEPSRNRDTGGTGLGLSIAHQLALAIGGTLTLRNRPAGGLSAELRLPG
jgi:hypothetical protein